MTVKFTGLTVLGSFTDQLFSGHRCWCTLDEEHHFIQSSYWPSSLYCRSQFTSVFRRPSSHLTNFSNEFSFLTKLLTVMVCRQPVLISTILELLSTALNCRIIIRTSAHRFYEPDQSLTLFQLFSTGLSLAGDVDMQRLDSSEAFFHKLLIIYSRIIFHAI